MGIEANQPSHSTWLDVRGAALRARVSAPTILREARVGSLRGYKIGGRRIWRFLPEDIDAWITKANTPVLATPTSARRSA